MVGVDGRAAVRRVVRRGPLGVGVLAGEPVDVSRLVAVERDALEELLDQRLIAGVERHSRSVLLPEDHVRAVGVEDRATAVRKDGDVGASPAASAAVGGSYVLDD